MLVAPGGEGLVAPSGFGEHTSAQDGDDSEDRDLVIEAEDIRLTQMEEKRIALRLVGIVDCLTMRQGEHEAAADEKHCQRRNKCRHFQDGHEHAVGQANHRAQERAKDRRRDEVEIEKTRRKKPGENHRDQTVGGPNRKIDIPVGNDESHSNRDDPHTRRVAQKRVKGLR